jgi:hypothetical protein
MSLVVLCPDPECGGECEVEQDGDHRYFECIECGYSFGYERQLQDLTTDTCAIGVPIEIRQRAMGEPTSVPVTLTKKG